MLLFVSDIHSGFQRAFSTDMYNQKMRNKLPGQDLVQEFFCVATLIFNWLKIWVKSCLVNMSLAFFFPKERVSIFSQIKKTHLVVGKRSLIVGRVILPLTSLYSLASLNLLYLLTSLCWLFF